jgi:nucleoid-associated protein YgaU
VGAPAGKPLVLAATHRAADLLGTPFRVAAPKDSSTRSGAPTLGWPSDADPVPPRPGPSWPSDPPADTVTVRPGDTLWLIAAHRLAGHPSESQIAGEWPRWYAANRAVIGAEPGLITPGTALVAPRPSTTAQPH